VDDLTAPLGKNRTSKRRFRFPIGMPQLLVGALSLTVIAFAAWAMLMDDPLGGEPTAVAPADLRAEAASQKPEEPEIKVVTGDRAGDKTAGPNRYDGPAPGQAPASQAPAAPTRTITIIDGSSGKRQEVVIPNGKEDGKSSAADERLTEPSRHGPLPKVAQDGARPADVFARPVKTDKPNTPKIAIVIGGLGIGATSTNDALKKLPGPVTLAFSPYGSDLERQVARARADGHEVLLQVPMEPFDYPDNDPGPQTLLTSLDAAQNVDRLHWQMARMQGYVGISNFMGARFVSSEQALAPVLREAAKRGLIYVDDGASPRSLASQIAGANNLAFAKSDVIIDAVPTATDIDRALARLEVIARDRGTAVGTASALPVAIDRIVRWAKAAEGRVLLVPITAAVAKAKSS
jgi:polysaccharide deacetylase 2 family uncharacterized protein YibQ